MPKRTTIILDDDVYEMLVRESIRRYKSTRALSRVVNELLRKAIRSEDRLIELIYAPKLVKVTSRDFEEFRRELSRRIEDR